MGAPLALKAALTFAILLPAGLLMGTLLPLGIKQASRQDQALIPWCWAINGATSVFASILSLAVGIEFGLSVELLLGWGAYATALLVLARWAAARGDVPARAVRASGGPGGRRG